MSSGLRFDLRRVSMWAMPLIWLSLLFDLSLTAHSLWLLDFYKGVEQGLMAQTEAVRRAAQIDRVGGLLGVGALIVLVACIILSGIWIFRAAANAQTLAPSDARITPGWAVGWFFVPFMNLYKPYVSMRQTWNTSCAPDKALDSAGPTLLSVWWGCWIFGNILSQASFRMSMRADDLQTAKTSEILVLLSAPLTISAAYFFIQIIKRVTQAQAQAATSRSGT